MAVELPEQAQLAAIRAAANSSNSVPDLREAVADLVDQVLELKKELSRLGALDDERFR